MITILLVGLLGVYLNLKFKPNEWMYLKVGLVIEGLAKGLIIGFFVAVLIGQILPVSKVTFPLEKINVIGVSDKIGMEQYLSLGNLTHENDVFYSFIYLDKGMKMDGTAKLGNCEVHMTSREAVLEIYDQERIKWFSLNVRKGFIFKIPTNKKK